VGDGVAWVRRAWPDLWPVVVAVVVVVGSLWGAVTPAAGDLKLTTEAVQGATLRGVRPGEAVDPQVAAAVDASLKRRGIAVRTGNLRLFLQDVAPAMRNDQTRLFRNLRAIGISVTYRRAESWEDYDAVRRYGPGTQTFRVSMRYVVSRSRLGQAATDVGYTYTVKQGQVSLVDDDDLDQAIGSNQQPWDFGPIEVLRRVNVIVIVEKGRPAVARYLADETIKSARLIRKIWPGQLQTVPMVVALHDPRVLTDLPPTLPGAEPARVRVMLSPDPGTIQPAGGWVVLRPGVQNSFDAGQMAHVLMHLLPVRLGDGAPRWLAEGMAEYAANQALLAAGRGSEVVKARAEIRKQSLRNLTRLPADDDFAVTDGYGISLFAVEQLINKAGLKAVTEYYRQVARRGYNEEARARLMKEYTGTTEARLVESVRKLAN
jgi:hypothetical protein